MKYSINEKELEEIYTAAEIDMMRLKDKSLILYCTKTIKSGDILENECYPVWNTRNSVRKAKQSISRETQIHLNRNNAVKKAIRLINTNFTKADIWATFTYSDDKLPESREAAAKEMVKYIRRLKTYAVKNKYPPLKYVYTTEGDKKTKRFHHHIIVNFPDRDVAEDLWKGGKRKNTRRLQPDETGLEALARYLTKESTKDKNKQLYVCSKNLIKPKETTSYFKVTRAQARKIANGDLDPMRLFQKVNPGYEFTDIKVKTSEYVSGCYLYVRMRRFRI